MISRRSRIEGGIWGLLVGDALGVPYEFHKPEDIPAESQIEFNPPAGFRRAHASVPPGTWSDDGAQALALLDTLLDCGKFDTVDFGQRLVDWYERGDYAVEGKVFDIGIQTSKAIRSISLKAPRLLSEFSGENSNGNGSLMRVLPLALWHRGTDAELAHDAHAQSEVTHPHARSQVCCALYCLWARNLLNEVSNPWETAVASLRLLYKDDETKTAELEFNIRPDDPPVGTGTGYVVDSLGSARMLLERGSYEGVVKGAVALGHDTDTTACIAGGIAGIVFGVEGIPPRWREALRGREILDPIVKRFIRTV